MERINNSHQSKALSLPFIFLLIFDLTRTTWSTPTGHSKPLSGSNNWCFIPTECDQDNSNSKWNKGTCLTGRAQSPIDISADYMEIEGDATIDFSAARKDYDFKSFEMHNDGKYLQLAKFQTVTGKPPKFQKGGSVYTLEDIHFHWGSEGKVGSEHSIAGKKYPLEMHLVHFKTSGADGGYKDVDEATSSGNPDALANIVIFFEDDLLEGSRQTYLQDLASNFGKVVNKGDRVTVKVANFKLSEILKGQTKAIAYSGSQTMPPCHEVVTWLILPQPVKAKPGNLKAFREKLKGFDKQPMIMNSRKTQEANGRLIGVIQLKQ